MGKNEHNRIIKAIPQDKAMRMSGNWARIIIGDSRKIPEIQNESVDLVVTSPPYWHIKDYGVSGQTGYNQSLHAYLKDLFRVWKEMYRVLKPGSRLCINIGDQFLRSVIYGRYRIVPLHAEIITQCTRIGLDYMGSIIWQKKTTINTSGGANVMGSFPYPRNGILEIDYEFILVFRKHGKQLVDPERKIKSKLPKEEWKEYFSSHWNFSGERQTEHEAMFPVELPKRLIKMFSLVGDVILDPFAGSGTTVKASLENGRNAVSCEINAEFLPVILKKIDVKGTRQGDKFSLEIKHRTEPVELEDIDYIPSIEDITPIIDPGKFKSNGDEFPRVREIVNGSIIELETGETVRLKGVKLTDSKGAESYLTEYIKGKKVFLRDRHSQSAGEAVVSAYVYLKNRIFVNRELVRRGFAEPLAGDPMLDRKRQAAIKGTARKS